MYTRKNFKSKKALRGAVAAGEYVEVYQPGPFGEVPFGVVQNGTVSVEGPHYPAAPTWYARVTLAEGRVVKVK